MKEVWESHLNDEVKYWKSMFDGSFHNKDWVAGFRRRVMGIDIAPSHVREWLGEGCRILDVGCGPATVLGGFVDGKKLDVTAIDPLANQYNRLYKEHNLCPLISPIYGEAENLSDVVQGKFHFVYSRNALDHSYNPIRAIQNMINICAKGGVVFFENAINEGYKEGYKGLHQWNFMPASGELVIWNKEGSAQLLGSELCSACFTSLTAFEIREGWVAVKITV